MSLALEIRRALPLRFWSKQSCWECFLEFMLGVWLSRFGGRCLFDFGVSNLIGSVFSNSDVMGAASFTCSTLAENFGKVICEVFDRMPVISAKLSVRVTGADKAGKVGASSISEIGPRGL
ncbi:hypothetical protein ACFX1S_026925 [Malus domestica]